VRITLSGTLGSGKSTVGKELARRLGVRYVSTGQIFRQLGHISNLDALQTNLEAEANRALDDQVDDKVRELNKTTPDFVIDSRMAWHFVEAALRVFLSVTPETAAQRIMSDRSRATEQYASIEAALNGLRARRDSELRRYRRLYNVDIEDASNYDISIITDNADVADVVDLILRRVNGETHERLWIPKARVLPLTPAPTTDNIALPQKVSVREDFRLPLVVRANIGLFFGRPEDLVRASRYELNLVPFEERALESLPRQETLRSVLAGVTAQDLDHWRSRFGIGPYTGGIPNL
jgi:predicted cytidylate kinase